MKGNFAIDNARDEMFPGRSRREENRQDATHAKG
jgi:hypothetical protein